MQGSQTRVDNDLYGRLLIRIVWVWSNEDHQAGTYNSLLEDNNWLEEATFKSSYKTVQFLP